MSDRIITSNLTAKAGDKTLVENASFSLEKGELIAVLGPNGAGKTSLIKAIMGLINPQSGGAMLVIRDISLMTTTERAQSIAYLPQTRPLAWPIKVRDIIALGRFAYGASPSRLKQTDRKAIDRAVMACGLEALIERNAETLSGGELARVHIARAFASETPFLFADEPVAALDPKHQYLVMDLIKRYTRRDKGALIVLHDISLAARYADRLIWMKEGKIIADGKPKDTLTPERLHDVYGVHARVNGTSVEILGV